MTHSERRYRFLLLLLTVTTCMSLYLLLKEAAAAQAWADPRPHVQTDPIVIEKVVEVPAGCKTEKCRIMSYILEKFQDDAADAITIINKCENHAFNPKATNHNSNGTWDAGIFQVNQVHGYSIDQMYDWKQNIDAAYKIFKNSGWSAWACSSHVNVKPFWQK